MRKAKIEFSESLLKRMAADPAHRGKEFTDAGSRNLVIYIALDGVVTFKFRKRMKGVPKGRIFEKLPPWSSAYTLAQARDACAVRRTELAQNGYQRKAVSKTVLESISMYERARANKDPLASRRGAPLRKKWKEHRDRFKAIFEPILGIDVNRLHRSDFTDCMDAFGEQWAKENKKPWDPRVLGPMMGCMMPMLRWYTTQFRLDPREIAGLVPPGYGDASRYLLPGEWQASAPHIDAMENDLGLLWRFMFYTCTRTSQALGMQWDEINWGNWRYWKDEDGNEHKALIWIPPRERTKAREQEGGEKLPRRVLITGESLTILERLRVIWEQNRAEHPTWNGVFTERMIQRYLSARTELQREVEKLAGTPTWDRKALRHTHATYLGFLGCPPNLISLSMNHSAREKGAGAALVTDRYNKADASKRFMATDPLAQLAPWHARLHKLLKDIERGFKSVDLAAMQDDMRDGQLCRDMCSDNGVNRAFIDVKGPKLAIVA